MLLLGRKKSPKKSKIYLKIYTVYVDPHDVYIKNIYAFVVLRPKIILTLPWGSLGRVKKNGDCKNNIGYVNPHDA